MWKGILQGYMMDVERRERETEREEARRAREEDRAFNRELYNLRVLEDRRARLLTTLSERRTSDIEEQESINSLVSLGFSRPSAEALYMTGELPRLMDAIEAQNVSRETISAYDQQVVSLLRERAEEGDTRAAALLGGILSGADLENPSEATAAIVESVISATTLETLELLELEVARGRPSRGTMQPFGLAMGTTELDPATINFLRKEITESLAPQFGPDALRRTPDGSIIINEANAPGLNQLITRTLRAAEADLISPLAANRLSLREAVDRYTTPIIDLRNANAAATPEDFLPFLPVLSEQGPQVFVETFQQNFVPTGTGRGTDTGTGTQVEDTGDTIELFTNRGARRPGGVRAPVVTSPEVTPTTGFDPSVFDDENLQ